MTYSGFIKWGPVTAFITIYDVLITDNQIVSAKAKITINGQSRELTLSSPLS